PPREIGRTQSFWSDSGGAPQYAQPPHAPLRDSHWTAERSLSTRSSRALRRRAYLARVLAETARGNFRRVLTEPRSHNAHESKCDMTARTPSSRFEGTTKPARAITSGCALAIAKDSPASSSSSRSLR